MFFYHRVYQVNDNICVPYLPIDPDVDPHNGGIPSLSRWGEDFDFIGPEIKDNDVMKLGNATVGMEKIEPRKEKFMGGWIAKNDVEITSSNAKNSEKGAFSSAFNMDDDDENQQPPTKPLHVPKRFERKKGNLGNDMVRRCEKSKRKSRQVLENSNSPKPDILYDRTRKNFLSFPRLLVRAVGRRL